MRLTAVFGRRKSVVCLLPPRRFQAQLRCELLLLLLLPRPGEEFAAAGDAEALVEGLDVVVDGVAAQAELRGDFFFAVAFHQRVEGLGQARREVGAGLAGPAD